HREGREDEGRRDRDHVPEAISAAEREREDRAVDGSRALAIREDDQGTEQERDHEGRHECEQLAADVLEPLRSHPLADGWCRGLDRRHQPAFAEATSPSIPRPTSSAGASGGYSPVIRPS